MGNIALFSRVFPVKADGAKTDCFSTDGNCPANAVCATTVCNCNAGWIDDGTGLCTGGYYGNR